MTSLDQKRAFERFPIQTLVDLEFTDQTYRHEFSRNMSNTGIYLDTDKLLPIGTKMTLRFVVPNLDWVFEIKSKVIWNVQVTMDQRLDGKKDGMGILFESMDSQDQEKIDTYFKNFKIEDLEL
jgi:uncharacterized protein (TIGR02266 family)